MDPSLVHLLTLILAGIAIYVARKHFIAQALKDRMEVFQWVESPITDDEIKSAQAIHEDLFGEEEFRSYYKDNEERVRRYIACYRKYHFILYSHGHERYLTGPYSVDLELWIQELAKIREFREVHRRCARYYPEYALYLERTAPELITARKKGEADLGKT